MNKKLWAVLGGIIVIGVAGSVYWFGFAADDEEAAESAVVKKSITPTMAVNTPAVEEPTQELTVELPKYYFVSEASTPIRVQPSKDALVDGTAYYGEKLQVMDHTEKWIRIAPIYQLDEGEEEVSQWVSIAGLSTQPVALMGERWHEVLSGYLSNSDDYNQYKDRFIEASTALVESKQCRLFDFEQVGGWIKSVNHPDNVYFTYCGGIEVMNKVYLNTTTGVVF
ncbi:hypothetical protein [Vibrio nomapromontoriensis]|uniref:hypothetical protein n=1 Tax=Vibrio nomapromontoriensis TaxID=2910246 RepID=UPI003D0FB510